MWELVPSIGHGGLIVPVSSVLIMLVLQPLVKNTILMGRSICAASSHAVVGLLAHDDSAVLVADAGAGAGALDESPRGPRHCERCARRGADEAAAALSRSDVAAVMASLRMTIGGGGDGEGGAAAAAWCGGCEAAGVVEELMESKVAGERELREAFYVFDRDEDGFVSAAELWNVLRRLGMEEGARYEDCLRMIAAFDSDGDGRISFPEFRVMMENAV